MKYSTHYGQLLLRYMMSDGQAMMKRLMLPENREAREGGWPEDHIAPLERSALADWMNDHGRDTEANLLRGNGHVLVHNDMILPAKHVISHVAHFDGSDYEELENLLNAHGDGGAARHLMQESYEPGHHNETEEWGYGHSDHIHQEMMGNHDVVLYHNPRYGYGGLEVGREAPDINHPLTATIQAQHKSVE